MMNISYYFKLFRASLILISFFILLTIIRVFRRKSPKRRLIISSISRYHCKKLQKVLGIQVRIKGSIPKDGNFLIACNHLSYIDIIVLQAFLQNTCFIAAKDMMEGFGLGTLIKHGNSYGIERRNRDKIIQDIQEMKKILNNGFNLLLFAEGKTSNGEEVLRFKEPLFDSAIQAKKKILPLTLNYVKINKESVSLRNRDSIYWYGRSFFLEHFKKFSKIKSTEIELIIDEPLDITNETSTSISIKAREAVAKNFIPIKVRDYLSSA